MNIKILFLISFYYKSLIKLQYHPHFTAVKNQPKNKPVKNESDSDLSMSLEVSVTDSAKIMTLF